MRASNTGPGNGAIRYCALPKLDRRVGLFGPLEMAEFRAGAEIDRVVNPCRSTTLNALEERTRSSTPRRPMPSYYLLHDPQTLQLGVLKRFGDAWNYRSFEPLLPLKGHIAIGSYCARYCLAEEQLLLSSLEGNWLFDRHLWNELLGEALLIFAVDLPLPPPGGDSLEAHFASDPATAATVTAATRGTQLLKAGGKTYRPEHAGWNASDETARLALELQSLRVDPLPGDEGDEEEREERELAIQFHAFLLETYIGANERGLAMVLEWN